MGKFEIRETDKDGCGSFYYFDAPDGISLEELGKLAETEANEQIIPRHRMRLDRARYSFIPLPIPRLKRTLNVIEIVGKKYIGKLNKRDGTIEEKEMTDWKAKRKGQRIKLSLSFIEFTFRGGNKERFEGYKYHKPEAPRKERGE